MSLVNLPSLEIFTVSVAQHSEIGTPLTSLHCLGGDSMKLFKRDRASASNETNRTVEPETHVEPAGHVHSNYLHWAWFRPTDLQNQVKR